MTSKIACAGTFRFSVRGCLKGIVYNEEAIYVDDLKSRMRKEYIHTTPEIFHSVNSNLMVRYVKVISNTS